MANVIGQRVRRKEDPRFLKGEGRYVDNMPPGDALHLTYVRSPVAHARITGIDVSEARSEEHTSELQSQSNLVCRLLLEKKKKLKRQTLPSLLTKCTPGPA